MAYNRTQAQKLCNATELELFIASLADEVTKLTPARLRSKITRTRALRDKNVDLFRRQTATIRTATGAKRGNTGVANVRTQQKANLFGEVLKRFEAHLAKVEAQANKASAKAASVKQPAAARKSVAKAPVVKASAAPKKPVAKNVAVKKAAAKAPAKKVGKPVVPARSAKAPAARPAVAKGPAVKRATEVSKTVQVRGKTIGAHARSANARGEAKRGSR